MVSYLIIVLLALLGFTSVITGEAIGERAHRKAGMVGYSFAIVLCLAVFIAPVRYLLTEPDLAKLGVLTFAIGAIAARLYFEQRSSA